MKVKTLLDLYFTARGPRMQMPENAVKQIRMLKAGMGDSELVDITNTFINDPETGYIAKRGRGEIRPAESRRPAISRPGSVGAELRTLLAASKWALRQRQPGGKFLITAEEEPIFDMPAAPPPRDRWLMREEATLLLRFAQPKPNARLTRAYRAITAGLFTAARAQAVATLPWDRIKMDIKRIEAGEVTMLGVVDYRDPDRPATKKRRALAPIMPEFGEVLIQARREARTPWFLDIPTYPEDAVTRCFREAGVEKGGPHILRHTWATWAAQDDVPMPQIAAMLADTQRTVERVYAHHHPDYMTAASSRRMFGGAFEVKPSRKKHD